MEKEKDPIWANISDFQVDNMPPKRNVQEEDND